MAILLKEAVSLAKKLTDKQKRFITEYLINFNATQAAVRAGYSQKTAPWIGAENLKKPQIQAEIQKQQEKTQTKLEITRERIVQELASIALANGADFAKVIRKGPLSEVEVEVEVTPTDEINPEKLPAIAGIKEGANGIEVKLHDKVRAIELLGKYLGYLEGPGSDKGKAASLADAIILAYNTRKEDSEE